jgi:hypothetical protein
LILTVRKYGSEFGRLQVLETLAHGNICSYGADPGIQDGLHKIVGSVELFEHSHPVVFVESAGHGAFGSQDHHSGYSLDHDTFTGSTGVAYIYEGKANRPQHANDRRVGCALLPIYEHWWQ